MARNKRITPQVGWAIYLRTSDEDAQNPEASKDRQLYNIHQSLINKEDWPVIETYSDTESGRNPYRVNYQRMLRDARQGKFSHVAVESPSRFGRKDSEALRAIDELESLNIQVRFANQPQLNHTNSDGRFYATLSFAMAHLESGRLSERVKGGILTAKRNGKRPSLAPDGYINKRERISGPERQQTGRDRSWIELDPKQAKMWRAAWELLLTNQYTLKEICEELHARGYTFRTGRPLVRDAAKGKRTHATNTLSKAFHDWTYAGYMVDEENGIPPKTVKGQWEPMVSVEDFERGLEILGKRQKKRAPYRKHFYLLRKIAYVEVDGEIHRLSGSTPNIRRNTGGNRYYCLPSSDVNISCEVIDSQIPLWIERIHVNPVHLPHLQQAYREEIAEYYGQPRDEIKHLKLALTRREEEEVRLLRAYAAGQFSQQAWEKVWKEVTEQQNELKRQIALLEVDMQHTLNDLDQALNIFHQLTALYGTLTQDEQQVILGWIIQKVIVDKSGKILRLELHPPFAYLVSKYGEVKKRLAISENKNAALNESGTDANSCSEYVLRSDPSETRVEHLANSVTLEISPTRMSLPHKTALRRFLFNKFQNN